MTENKPDFGVLLINLGTPDAPTANAVKTYLREFLSDPRVVDLNPLIWKPILNLVILNIRPKKVAELYKKAWFEDGSPLLVLGKRLAQKVGANFDDENLNIPLVNAMTYGTPSIAEGLDDLRKQGVDKVVILPMYPQFSGTTTAAVYDAVFKALSKSSDWPSLHFIRDYANHPLYIKALANSVRNQWEAQGEQRHLLFSYHGIPKRYVSNGDPYEKHCNETSKLVAEELGLNESQWTHSYQSRFGREEWLKPYADETLKTLAQNGIKSLNVISPAFAVDCLETLEEICFELKEVFEEAGGEKYDYIPALNDNDDHVALYRSLILENSSQWCPDK
ncbi:ferrochelatase [Marinomonas sp. PE14-40]|uniref:ferrochelatase n=1 Tax=Marinomonas sp. PE14-40 TaxID=3060621 RepID=UPI003F66D532